MSDFIAAQDQSYAAAIERLGLHPKQFILAWSNGSTTDIGMVMFAQPEFVVAVIQGLTEGLMFNEPTVLPPPE